MPVAEPLAPALPPAPLLAPPGLPEAPELLPRPLSKTGISGIPGMPVPTDTPPPVVEAEAPLLPPDDEAVLPAELALPPPEGMALPPAGDEAPPLLLGDDGAELPPLLPDEVWEGADGEDCPPPPCEGCDGDGMDAGLLAEGDGGWGGCGCCCCWVDSQPASTRARALVVTRIFIPRSRITIPLPMIVLPTQTGKDGAFFVQADMSRLSTSREIAD